MKKKDNIENFFKNRLNDKRQFDFQESDWAKMEAKLDDAGMFPTVGFFESLFSKIWFWILATLIVTFLFGWYANDTFRDTLVAQNTEIIDVQKSANTADNQSNKNEAIVIQDLTLNSINEDNGEQEIVGNSTGNEVNTKDSEAALNDKVAESKATNKTSSTIITESDKTLIAEGNINKQKASVLTNSIADELIENQDENSNSSEVEVNALSNENSQELTNNQLSESVNTNDSKQKSGKVNTTTKSISLVEKDESPIMKSDLENDNEVFANHSASFVLDFINFKLLPSIFEHKVAQGLSFNQVNQETISPSSSLAKDSLGRSTTSQNPYSRLSVGLSYAPDANSVGFAEQLSITSKFSFQLYFRLTNKFAISSGVAYSKKKYITEGKNYSPENADVYWTKRTNGILPKDIDGFCSVVDIPLNLTYTWNPDKKLKILSTVGVSNYILLDENYQYEFAADNPGSDTQWVTDDNSKVYFGLANISLAAAWNINKKLEFQVEPYLKAPLKKIGFGNVSLYSSGIYFTLKVKFLSKKRRYLIPKPPD